MEGRSSAILRYLVDLRSILLGFAIFNLTTAWLMDREIRMCTLGPYPTRLAYLIEPTILLISSLFLSMNRRWGNAVALLISGCLLVGYVRLLLINNDPVTALEYWTHSEVLHLSRQILFALIVFSYSALQIKKTLLSRKVTAPVKGQSHANVHSKRLVRPTLQCALQMFTHGIRPPTAHCQIRGII
jgi:hypothetical protein